MFNKDASLFLTQRCILSVTYFWTRFLAKLIRSLLSERCVPVTSELEFKQFWDIFKDGQNSSLCILVESIKLWYMPLRIKLFSVSATLYATHFGHINTTHSAERNIPAFQAKATQFTPPQPDALGHKEKEKMRPKNKKLRWKGCRCIFPTFPFANRKTNKQEKTLTTFQCKTTTNN